MNTDKRKQIEEVLVDCLKELAADKFPAELKPEDDVIQCCDLESQHGVELACDLASRLEIEIPLKDNPLIEDSGASGGKRARRLSEVVDYLLKLSQ